MVPLRTSMVIFSLSGVKDNDVLSVTYIGYITQEVKVGNQKNN